LEVKLKISVHDSYHIVNKIYVFYEEWINNRRRNLKYTKIAVVAAGGNSLIKDKLKTSFQDQLETAVEICDHITIIGIIKAGYNTVITHENGPQVDFSLIRSDTTSHIFSLVPIDACGADTQGTIGYMIQQSLYNKFKEKGINKKAAIIVTQVKVNKDDLVFKNPTKPVGPFYSQEKAEKLQKDKNWTMIEDSGRGYRRVLPSPIPIEIMEIDVIKHLVDGGFTTIAVGGDGGIPVIEDERGDLKGCEVVIDKNYASSLLGKN